MTQLRHEGRTWRKSGIDIFCRSRRDLSRGVGLVLIRTAAKEIESVKEFRAMSENVSSARTSRVYDAGNFFA